MQNKNSNILINKLDAFIKKYYLNLIVKGLILSLTILGVIYLTVITLEYFGRFSVVVRTVLFYSGLVAFLAVFSYMIIIPVLKLFKIGKRINYKQASKIIGNYFPEISDKLQNTLELSELVNQNEESKDILLASINQRTEKLSPLPFLTAIKINENLKYLKFFVPVIVIISALFAFWPFIITEGTERIINFRTFYETPAPFKFELINDSLSVRRGGDYKVKLKTSGRYVPSQVLLNYRGNDFFMEQESPGVFSYTLRNLNSDLDFYFSAMDIKSEKYNLKVLPAPIIIDFTISINPPTYTGIERSTVNNSGDISVPLGSQVKWSFNTANLQNLTAIFDTTYIEADKQNSTYEFSKQILNPGTYNIYTENEYFKEQTGLTYQINVIPDLYPSIGVDVLVDSTDMTIYYFNGMIDDDYGFNSLTFNYIPGENSDTLKKVDIPFSRNMKTQSFYFAFDFSSVDFEGRQITYYFEVGDNDAINGSKKSRTQSGEFIIPSLRDIESESERIMESIESDVNEAQSLADEIQKDIEKLQKDIIDNQLSDWERQQNIEQIAEKQMQMEDLLQKAADEQKELSQYQEQWKKDEELVKKHEQIQDLLENLMDDEMKKLIEELQKLAQDFDMSEFQDLMEEMKRNTEDLETQMDRTLELLKRMEVEQRLENTVNKLEELAQKHEELAEQTRQELLSEEELLEKHEEHKLELDQIQEDYDKTLEKNEDLKKPFDFDDFTESFEKLKDDMDQTSDQISGGDNEGASDSQKQESQEMQEMSEQMQMMMDQQMMQQHMENMQHMRQLLNNLLTFSFEQEDVMVNMKGLSVRDPRYRDLMVRQGRAKENFEVIRDSLNALGSRVPELGSTFNREQAEIYRNLDIILDNIADNRQQRVQTSQQLVMTSTNNIALLLSEVMEQMQQTAMQMGGEGGDCNNCESPGEGEMGEMRDMQEGLKQQLQQLIDQMQNGETPGNGQSEQLARMLMQQEMMQKKIQDMISGGINPEATKILNEINRMIEENISDLINRNITPETISRQEMILTRLLQAEKSEREREIDDQRESKEAKDYKLSNPDKAFKEKEEELRFNELLQISNIKLNPYYQNRYKEYLKKLDQE